MFSSIRKFRNFTVTTKHSEPDKEHTVKFINFRTPENIAIIYLKFKQRRQTIAKFHQKGANGIANSEDPDQTAPLGAV